MTEQIQEQGKEEGGLRARSGTTMDGGYAVELSQNGQVVIFEADSTSELLNGVRELAQVLLEAVVVLDKIETVKATLQ